MSSQSCGHDHCMFTAQEEELAELQVCLLSAGFALDSGTRVI